MNDVNRSLTLDTETTGFDPKEGHRIVEIGVLELLNGVPSGEKFHVYINPQRDMPVDAFKVHGLSSEFLSDKPLFIDVADDFLNFIGNDTLIIHNAAFDMAFLNAELKACGRQELSNKVVDTLIVARKAFPGKHASLDALCRRFNIDNSDRTLHGALIDARLLADVYMQLMGGPQNKLSFKGPSAAKLAVPTNNDRIPRVARPAQPIPAADAERHRAFTERLGLPEWTAEPASSPSP